MGVLLGIAAGILLGVSDFMANRASRTISSASVSRTNLAVSGLIAPLLLFVKPVEWTLARRRARHDLGHHVVGRTGHALSRLHGGAHGHRRADGFGVTGGGARAVRPHQGKHTEQGRRFRHDPGSACPCLDDLPARRHGQRQDRRRARRRCRSVVRRRVHAHIADVRRSRPVAGVDPTHRRPVVPDRVAALRQGADPGLADAGASLGDRLGPGRWCRPRVLEARIHQRMPQGRCRSQLAVRRGRRAACR